MIQQTVLFCLCDWNNRTVTRGEHALRLCVLDKLEGLKVGRGAELVMVVNIAVVQDRKSVV